MNREIKLSTHIEMMIKNKEDGETAKKIRIENNKIYCGQLIKKFFDLAFDKSIDSISKYIESSLDDDKTLHDKNGYLFSYGKKDIFEDKSFPISEEHFIEACSVKKIKDYHSENKSPNQTKMTTTNNIKIKLDDPDDSNNKKNPVENFVHEIKNKEELENTIKYYTGSGLNHTTVNILDSYSEKLNLKYRNKNVGVKFDCENLIVEGFDGNFLRRYFFIICQTKKDKIY